MKRGGCVLTLPPNARLWAADQKNFQSILYLWQQMKTSKYKMYKQHNSITSCQCWPLSLQRKQHWKSSTCTWQGSVVAAREPVFDKFRSGTAHYAHSAQLPGLDINVYNTGDLGQWGLGFKVHCWFKLKSSIVVWFCYENHLLLLQLLEYDFFHCRVSYFWVISTRGCVVCWVKIWQLWWRGRMVRDGRGLVQGWGEGFGARVGRGRYIGSLTAYLTSHRVKFEV